MDPSPKSCLGAWPWGAAPRDAAWGCLGSSGKHTRAGHGLRTEPAAVRGSVQPALPPPASARAFVSGAQPRLQSSKC